MEAPESGQCYKCRAECDSDSFCYGCEEFICDDMDCSGSVGFSLASAIGHGHMPDDHFVDADEAADDELGDL